MKRANRDHAQQLIDLCLARLLLLYLAPVFTSPSTKVSISRERAAGWRDLVYLKPIDWVE